MAASRALTDHEEIRQWAEARNARPACVTGTGGGGDTGMIRLDFPGFSGGDSLQEVSWDEWFRSLDENNLALLVQDQTAGGEQSNFNKLVDRSTAAGGQRSRRAGGGGRARSAAGRGGARKTAGGARKSARGGSRKGAGGGSRKAAGGGSRKGAGRSRTSSRGGARKSSGGARKAAGGGRKGGARKSGGGSRGGRRSSRGGAKRR